MDLPNQVLTRSGRSAIVLALKLLGIGRGDGVLVPTYHCPTMIAPIEYVGAAPTYYRMTSRGTPDLDHLHAATSDNVRAMLVPHLFGLQIPLNDVAEFCRVRRIALIEDCAHCFFGLADAVPVGSTGDFAIGSLPKFFPVLGGGILASAKRPLAATTLAHRPIGHELRSAWDLVDMAGRSGRLGVVGVLARGTSQVRRALGRRLKESKDAPAEPSLDAIRKKDLSDPMLMPTALSRIESTVLARADCDANVCRRRENYAAIAEALFGLQDSRLPFPDCTSDSAPYVVPLLIGNPDPAYARMRAAGLPVFRWDRLWPGTPLDPHDATTTWSRGLIQIACHQSLRGEDVSAMCSRIRDCVVQCS